MNVPYCYLKAPTFGQRQKKRRQLSIIWRGFSLMALLTGMILIGNVVYPIASYELSNRRFTSTSRVISPLSASGKILGETAENSSPIRRSWYPEVFSLPPQPSNITHYTISIPKLGIDQAIVQIGGEDLMKSLIHYSGTSLPGQYGNAVIFGHSVLPQFFNPKNYRTIFSTLPQLKIGDEILVYFDGITYRYLVQKIIEVSPKDVSVLRQDYSSQMLSLVTCVPPGTYLRRLVVQSELVKI